MRGFCLTKIYPGKDLPVKKGILIFLNLPASLKVWTPTTTWLASPCNGGWSCAEPSTALSSFSPRTAALSPTSAQSQLGLSATTVTSTSITTTTTRSTPWGSPESCRQSIQSLNLTRSHWPSWKCQTLQLCRYQSHRNYKINFHPSKPYKLDIDEKFRFPNHVHCAGGYWFHWNFHTPLLLFEL